ncbi:MAG TPA: head GIN domain-containing protein [Myxococcota bacterium]|nr:head GIN domain-containing protein [Myxococcota bacterium]HRY92978.1 head GIN domain-containing protein [Myxococcota bacterium]HSA19913.1 head GIN domain-containing protein [Myxococcota bacterium]
MLATKCLMILSFFLFSGPGCVPAVAGSGRLETRALALAGFDRVHVGGAFEAVVERGDGFLVEVTLDDNLFADLRAVVEEHTLHLGLRDGCSYRVAEGHQRVRVRLPRLERLQITGASEVKLVGFGQAGQELEASLSGASELEGELGVDRLALELSGASEARLQGRAGQLVLVASGASEASLGELSAGEASVDLSGASEALVRTDGRLDAEASGASELHYLGQAKLGRVETSGASEIGGSEAPVEAAPAPMVQ